MSCTCFISSTPGMWRWNTLGVAFVILIATVRDQWKVSADSVRVFNTTKPVTAMLDDHFHQSELLIATPIGIYSWNSNNLLLRAGSDTEAGYNNGLSLTARFREIVSLAQLNRTHILVLDLRNHCLRSWDGNTVSQFAGKCGHKGYADSIELEQALFSHPSDMVVMDQFVYIVDSGNSVIRLLDTDAGVVVMLMRINERELHAVRGITLYPEHRFLYLAGSTGVMKTQDPATSTTHHQTLIPVTNTSLSQGNTDGMFSESQFNGASKMEWLDTNHMVVIDEGNKKIRLLNFSSGEVKQFCSECNLESPRSMLHLRDSLYIGEDDGVTIVPIPLGNARGISSSSFLTSEVAHANLKLGIGISAVVLVIGILSLIIFCRKSKFEMSTGEQIPSESESILQRPQTLGAEGTELGELAETKPEKVKLI